MVSPWWVTVIRVIPYGMRVPVAALAGLPASCYTLTFWRVLMILNILNISQLKSVCSTTLRLKYMYLRPHTCTIIHQRHSTELPAVWRGKLVSSYVIKIRFKQAVQCLVQICGQHIFHVMRYLMHVLVYGCQQNLPQIFIMWVGAAEKVFKVRG